jgi:hypothetical protein
VAAVLTAVLFVFILAARHPYSAKSPSHQISLVAYILLASPCGHWSESSSEAPRDSQLAAGLMRSVFNRTNNENGIAAALLNGDLYPLGDPHRSGRTHRRPGIGGRAPTAQQGLPPGT